MYLWGKSHSDIFFIDEKQRREIKEKKDFCRQNVKKNQTHPNSFSWWEIRELYFSVCSKAQVGSANPDLDCKVWQSWLNVFQWTQAHN